MSTTIPETRTISPDLAATYTPEEFLRMPDGDRYELIDGKLVERNSGAQSSQVAASTMGLVCNHVHTGKLGKTFATDCGYQIFADDPKRVRFPDGSFISRGRLPGEKTPKGFVRIPPDLAVEVVSPNDTAEMIEAKRVDFLNAGTRLLWVIYPETRTVHVFRQEGGPSILTEGDELGGEDVLPEFVCRVAELFKNV